MAGAVRIIDSVSAITADQNDDIAGNGAHAAATFILDTTTITVGTWIVTLQYQIDGVFIDIAVVTRTAAEGAGLELFVLDPGNFDLTRQAIPEPTRVFWNETVDGGAITANVIAMYGD